MRAGEHDALRRTLDARRDELAALERKREHA
jgi:hypothetical protein